jgi:hypothetical protein
LISRRPNLGRWKDLQSERFWPEDLSELLVSLSRRIAVQRKFIGGNP